MRLRNLIIILTLLSSSIILSKGLVEIIPLEQINKQEYYLRLVNLCNRENQSITTDKVQKLLESEYFKKIQYDSLEHKMYRTSLRVISIEDKDYSKNLDNYLQVLSFYRDNNTSQEEFKEWFSNLEYIAKQRRYIIKKYLENTKNLVVNNQLCKEGDLDWSFSSYGKFKFGVKNFNIEVEFIDSIDLYAHRFEDMMLIQSTIGKYTFVDRHWYGTGGKVTWDKSGVRGVNAKIIGDYEINMINPKYKIDSCIFTNPTWFDEPMSGILEDKLMSKNSKLRGRYPRFSSHRADIEFHRLAEYFNFKGKVRQEANSIKGFSSGKNASELTFKDTSGVSAKFTVSEVALKKNFLFSPKATVRLTYNDITDFIVNNQITVRYAQKDEVLRFGTTSGKNSNVRYLNSFHNLLFNADNMIYDTKTKDLVFENKKYGNTVTKKTYFESTNYFDEKYFLDIFGFNDTHPFSMIMGYRRKYPHDEKIYLDDFANYIRHDISEIKLMINSFSKKGFVHYNQEEGYFYPLQKTSDYLKFFSKKKDYDQIRFVGSIDSLKRIGTINLDSMSFIIYKPDYIQISETKKVFIIPEIPINYRKGGSFKTGGELSFGPLYMYGGDYDFDYEKYTLGIKEAEKLRIRMHTGEYNEYGEPEYKVVSSDIEEVDGYAVIDYPNNKSTMYKFKEYPQFVSNKPSFIYWNKKSIAGGAYNKERFFYKLKPFKLDSLSESGTSNISFDGVLHSSVFPEFEQKIKVQKDFSLGFNLNTGENWKHSYGNSKFKGELSLDSKGLQGNGRFIYKTIDFFSSDMVFLLDDFHCTVDSTNIVESHIEKLPALDFTDARMHWSTRNDSMLFNSQKNPILVGEKKDTELKGSLLFTGNEYLGSGVSKYKYMKIKSQRINYKVKGVKADSARIEIYDKGIKDNLFESDSVSFSYDYKSKIGTCNFKSEKHPSLFPINNIVAESQGLKFNLQALEFTPIDEEPFFMQSVRDDMEDVSFFADKITYNTKKRSLKLDGIDQLKVYTSEIKLADNSVEVQLGGSLGKIGNAELYLDDAKHHRLIEANIDLNNSASYRANGKYLYYDRNKTPDTIGVMYLSREIIGIVGYANVNKKNTFQISPEFECFGKVGINSTKLELSIKGVLRIRDIDARLKSEWFPVNFEFVADSIYVPLNKLKRNQYIGPVYSYKTNSIYPCYINKRRKTDDRTLLNTKSLYMKSTDNNYVEFMSKDKINNPLNFGSFISLNKFNGDYFGNTNLTLLPKTGFIKQKHFGEFTYLRSENKFEMSLASSYKFPLQEEILDKINSFVANASGLFDDKEEEIVSDTTDSGELSETEKLEDEVEALEDEEEDEEASEEEEEIEVDEEGNPIIKISKEELAFTHDFKKIGFNETEIKEKYFDKVDHKLVQKLMGVIDTNSIKNYIQNYFEDKEDKTFSVDKKSMTNIVFQNTDYIFNKRAKAYYSKSQIDVHSFGEYKINKKLDGVIELKEGRNYSSFTIYLSLNENDWIMLNYNVQKLNIFCSNAEIMTELSELSEGDRTYEDKDNKKIKLTIMAMSSSDARRKKQNYDIIVKRNKETAAEARKRRLKEKKRKLEQKRKERAAKLKKEKEEKELKARLELEKKKRLEMEAKKKKEAAAKKKTSKKKKSTKKKTSKKKNSKKKTTSKKKKN
jgi:hypothetical protein